MAIEKGKVILAIENKYKGKGFSKTFINTVAAKIAEDLDSEDDIEGKLDELDFMFTSSMSETDRRVTDAVQKAKKPEAPKEENKNNPTAPPAPTPTPEDAPEWAKGLFSSIQTLAATVNGIVQKETAQTLSQRFHADPRLKGLNPILLKGRVPLKEEDLEDAIASAAEELKDYFPEVSEEENEEVVTTPAKPSTDKPKPTPGGKILSKQDGKVKPATTGEIDDAMKLIKV